MAKCNTQGSHLSLCLLHSCRQPLLPLLLLLPSLLCLIQQPLLQHLQLLLQQCQRSTLLTAAVAAVDELLRLLLQLVLQLCGSLLRCRQLLLQVSVLGPPAAVCKHKLRLKRV